MFFQQFLFIVSIFFNILLLDFKLSYEKNLRLLN